ncbi:PAS domain-containing protein [Bacillus salacetis]|uniref:PAS domain-containing protein n=1 Tax=Bacillus salacetis TaxID=2315464 RepID=A0A3A1QQD2_9BACI|nr:sigma 54-interacting transcriptional regulator [Bacillus salacetis]RIW29263.1 PAS domain-containing protein [Bacillus salacetis]
MRKLIVVAGTKETEIALTNQLISIFGKLIKFEGYAIDEGLPDLFENELILYSSSLIEDEVEKHIDFSTCKIIVATRTVNYEFIDRIFALAPGQKVLYVNDFMRTAEEAIATLKGLGITHIDYVPFSSESREIPQGIDIAISPGEGHLIPSSINTRIDIGVRLIDLNTIMKIISHFQLSDNLSIDITNRYTKKIIDLSQKLSQVHMKAKTLNRFLNRVVDGVNDGILAFQEDGEITVFNEVLEKMLGISPSFAIGKKLSQVFRNHELTNFLYSKETEAQVFLTLRQRDVMIFRFRMNDEAVTVATFKDMDETIEMEKLRKQELQKRGYIAKYTFSNILGSSPAIYETKTIAAKLAKSGLPVLIHGETGTGKELFSSAIHNESNRKDEPFLAINCGALPEDLLESELFGYEEGAFTGAVKGGKKGVFEQADGGTLFLDEIGDISLKLQARLLRVLEEMEIRRIGGTKNISVDVRIISATNKPLSDLVAAGTFREDLYHRLKVLTINLPSLQERKEDIPLLAESFILQETGAGKALDSELIHTLNNADWKGNIRELKNTILYMIAVSESGILTVHDLPRSSSFNQQERSLKVPAGISPIRKKEYIALLLEMRKLLSSNQNASREKLREQLADTPTPLSLQQIRTRMKELEDLEWIKIHKGRKGTELTEKGMNMINTLKAT